MPDIPKPDGPDVNIGPSILAVEWALAGIAAVVLALRWISVVFFLRRVSLADYLMLLAFICAVVQGALLTESYKWGLGRHFYYLTDVQRFHAMRLLFLLQGWGIASPMFGRISFSFFMLHIFGERKHNKFSAQWPFWFTIISQAIVNIATIILIYTQCGAHPQALWDPTVHAQCLSPQAQTNFSYFQCALNSATDLYLTVLPAMAMRGLNMNWAKKTRHHISSQLKRTSVGCIFSEGVLDQGIIGSWRFYMGFGQAALLGSGRELSCHHCGLRSSTECIGAS